MLEVEMPAAKVIHPSPIFGAILATHCGTHSTMMFNVTARWINGLAISCDNDYLCCYLRLCELTPLSGKAGRYFLHVGDPRVFRSRRKLGEGLPGLGLKLKICTGRDFALF